MAAECVDRMVGCDGTLCIGLNSLPIVGGIAVVGTDPGIVGETEIARRAEEREREKRNDAID